MLIYKLNKFGKLKYLIIDSDNILGQLVSHIC